MQCFVTLLIVPFRGFTMRFPQSRVVMLQSHDGALLRVDIFEGDLPESSPVVAYVPQVGVHGGLSSLHVPVTNTAQTVLRLESLHVLSWLTDLFSLLIILLHRTRVLT